MIYVKSLLVAAAVFLAALVPYLWIFFVFWIRPTLPKSPSGGSVGIDVRVFLEQPLFWLILLLSPAIAFYWEFRRASR